MISDNFLENTREEMEDFLDYCEARGWVRFPFTTYSNIARKARKLVSRCLRLGLVKLPVHETPAQIAARAEVLRHRTFVCGGQFKAHRWNYVPGVGDCCVRCNSLSTRKHNRKNEVAA